jgi:pyrroloquinoline quinone biosynthesis protein B
VSHRDELSDTVAYLIEGPSRKLLWLPDIDSWDRWERGLEEVLASVDYAFLDATFHSAQELPGRSLAEIPHPLATDTAARVAAARTRGLKTRVFLLHFNHSNPLLGPDPSVREAIEAMGVEVAEEGLRLGL